MVEDLNIEAEVEKATSEDEWDALDYFSNSTLPETRVTLYRDTAAAYRLTELKEEQQSAKKKNKSEGLGLADPEGYVDEDEIDELINRLDSSAVVFHLRALAPAARNALEKSIRAKYPYSEGAANEEYGEAFNANLIAKSIVSITNASGKKDTKTWDAARVLKFIETAEQSEWAKILEGVFRINYIGDAIDKAVNADF